MLIFKCLQQEIQVHLRKYSSFYMLFYLDTISTEITTAALQRYIMHLGMNPSFLVPSS